MTLEKRLEEAVISFTDKFTYFPCILGQPKSITLPYYHWNFKKPRSQERFDTLYVSVKDKTKDQIKESIYEGLTGIKQPLHKINDEDRYLLHWKYVENIGHIKRLQRQYR